MEFQEVLQCLFPPVILGWIVLAIRQRSANKTWLDSLFTSLMLTITGGLFGMPRVLSLVTRGLYNNGILIKNPDLIIVYDGIPFVAEAAPLFGLIGEWVLIVMFFVGLFWMVQILIHRARGDKSYSG
jgi:hypothetical protein